MKKIIYTVILIIVFTFSLQATSYTISISGNTYSPSSLTVKVGDDVTIGANSYHTLVQVDETTWNDDEATPMTGGWGAKNSSYSFTATDVGTIYYVCSDHVRLGMKGTITVESNRSINLTAPASGSILCQGANKNITWTSKNVTNAKIELSEDGGSNFSTTIAASIPASTGSYSWVIPAGQTAGNQYKIRISDESDATLNSETGIFSISGTASITAQPQSKSSCTGQSVSFSVSSSDYGLTYQWQKDGVNINGATAATYTKNNVVSSDAGNYACVVSNSCGTPVTSDIAELSVDISASITQQPTSQETCIGNYVTFTALGVGTNVTYQWQKNNIAIPGATNPTYTISSAQPSDVGNYSVVVNGKCNSPVTSQQAILTIDLPPAITKNPKITAPPCTGDSLVLSVTATGTGLNYQWRKDGANIPNSNNSVFVIHNIGAENIGSYDVVITGKCQPSVTSDAVFMIPKANPKITSQPASQSILAGLTVDLTVAATGDNLLYQWKKDGTPLNGKTSQILHLDNVQASDSGSYSCVVSNSCAIDVSNVAKLTVLSNSVPILTLLNSNIEFGAVSVGVPKDTSITNLLKNSGSVPLIIQGIQIVGLNPNDFTLTGVQLPITIPPNGTSSLTFEFKPADKGLKTAMVVIASNASANPPLYLFGVGGNVKITSDVSLLTFIASGINNPVNNSLTLKNEGDADVEITGTINGSQKDLFMLILPTGSITIPAGMTQQVTISYNPTGVSTASAELDIKITGISAPITIPLQGEIVASVQDLTTIGLISSFNIYPNPATDNFRADFYVNDPIQLDITIYDIYGNQVKSLSSQLFNAGEQKVSWDGFNDDGVKSACGEYMIVFKAGSSIKSYFLVFLR